MTVSSLGYGDMRPIGYSKAVASIEVLFGIFFIGIIIAKITSHRTSYHIRKLFKDNIKQKLNQYAVEFETLNEIIINTHADDFYKTIICFQENALSFNKYIDTEKKEGDFLTDVPSESLNLVGKRIIQVLANFDQLISNISSSYGIRLLNENNRRIIVKALISIDEVCRIFTKSKIFEEIFQKAIESCNKIREGYFMVPELMEEPEQTSDNPDELSF